MIVGMLIEKPSPLKIIYVHEENAIVPSQYSLFGKDQVKPLRPSQGDVAYMEIELERSLMKKIPRWPNMQ